MHSLIALPSCEKLLCNLMSHSSREKIYLIKCKKLLYNLIRVDCQNKISKSILLLSAIVDPWDFSDSGKLPPPQAVESCHYFSGGGGVSVPRSLVNYGEKLMSHAFC